MADTSLAPAENGRQRAKSTTTIVGAPRGRTTELEQ